MISLDSLKKTLLESEAVVLEETHSIQYAYRLKRVTRYIVKREEEVASESVAEHVYALHLLADYFLPLEDTEQEMDWNKIHDMLQYHDIDEIETGDMIGYLKTDSDRMQEAEAQKRVVGRFPQHLQRKITTVLEEYETQATAEAKFAKAVDRIEPMFQLFNENGKRILAQQNTTSEQSWNHKKPYLENYPYLYRFFSVIEQTMEKAGYFH